MKSPQSLAILLLASMLLTLSQSEESNYKKNTFDPKKTINATSSHQYENTIKNWKEPHPRYFLLPSPGARIRSL
jgi:hypothetical protein